ncbi:MAG: hypothetical protein WCW16_00770 [Candidatus Magasanikbacteria bacterium]
MVDDGRQEQRGFDLAWAIKDYRNDLAAFNFVVGVLREKSGWMVSLRDIEKTNGGVLVKKFLDADKNYRQYPMIDEALKQEKYQKFIRDLDELVDRMNNYSSLSLKELKELLVTALKKTQEFSL